MADERETLLGGIDDDSNPTKKALGDGDAKTVPVQDLARARNMFFWWTFIGYICWGINAELYSNLFYDVIDKGDYSSVSVAALSTTPFEEASVRLTGCCPFAPMRAAH